MAEQASVIPPQLPACCHYLLARPGWFTTSLLQTVHLRLANWPVRLIQAMARVPVAATTIGDVIYFSAAMHWQPHSAWGISLLAHELRHVEQYREQGGLARFGILYTREYLHGGYGSHISFEAEAYHMGSQVYEHICRELAHNAGYAVCTGAPGEHWPNPAFILLPAAPLARHG